MKAKAINQEQLSLHAPKPQTHKLTCSTYSVYQQLSEYDRAAPKQLEANNDKYMSSQIYVNEFMNQQVAM